MRGRAAGARRRRARSTSACDASAWMSTKATRAPWPAKASTMAAPMPEPPPVMRTTAVGEAGIAGESDAALLRSGALRSPGRTGRPCAMSMRASVTRSPTAGASSGSKRRDDLALAERAGRPSSPRRSARPPRPAPRCRPTARRLLRGRDRGGEMFSGRMPKTTRRPAAPSRSRRRQASCRTAAAPPLAMATPGRPSSGDDLGGQEIHRRRAHEAGDEHVGRPLVDRRAARRIAAARP